jgi:catechol 2,3-dioxygenase-like lactoylglutathione lyase family enzyme
MDAKVAMASTSVPRAVANEAMVAQFVETSTIGNLGGRVVVGPCRRALGLIDGQAWQTPSMLDHVSIQCTDIEASAAFYDTVLAPLAGTRVMEFDDAIGYGIPPVPTFWIGRRQTGDGFRESHIAFTAPNRAAVDSFFQAAVTNGAEPLHAPHVWPEYHPNYYGAFVRDPDGNNVESVCHSPD